MIMEISDQHRHPYGLMQPYDIIGDIHGYADVLEELLRKLGYEERSGSWRHPLGRKALFVGDYIDRGPSIRRTLRIVRGMVETGAAMALLGNHEFNALCYHTPDGAGGFLRVHSDRNTAQHRETLDQFVLPYPEEWHSYLQWFKDLPLFLDIEGLRVVHASWDAKEIRLVRGRSFHDPDFLELAATKETPEFEAVETLLKGPEIQLPDGRTCPDKEGTERREIRVAWWQSPKRNKRLFYKDIAIPGAVSIPEATVPAEDVTSLPSYSRREPPVIFGHYWLAPHKPPQLLEHNAACVDYSVATKGGFLTAYSWSGEKELKTEHFTVSDRLD
jgi:hypothetical protein